MVANLFDFHYINYIFRSTEDLNCAGLRANKAQLIRARDLIRKSLNKGLTIKLYVQIGVN